MLMMSPRRMYHTMGRKRYWEYLLLIAFLLFFYGPLLHMFMLAFANGYVKVYC